MTRSRRKTPIIPHTTAESDKVFKTMEHRRERHAAKVAIAQGEDPPDPRHFGDPWQSQKDGKQFWPKDDRRK